MILLAGPAPDVLREAALDAATRPVVAAGSFRCGERPAALTPGGASGTAYSRPHVPPEFTGLARIFCNQARCDDLAATAAIDRITAPLMRRFRRHPVPRAETIADTARVWRTGIPAAGRLDLAISAGRKTVTITELRVGAADIRLPGWTADEHGIVLHAVELIAEPHHLALTVAPIAYVGLHGLARWHQRSFDSSRAALLADLHALARWTASITSALPSEFTVPAASGRWLGRGVIVTQDGNDIPIAAARTFKQSRTN